MAKHLGIKHPSLHSWRRVPGQHCLEIERLTGIPRETLRPDIFAPTPVTISVKRSERSESSPEISESCSESSGLFTETRKEIS